jgi:hypothetical protein
MKSPIDIKRAQELLELPIPQSPIIVPNLKAQDLRDLIELAAYDLDQMIQGKLTYKGGVVRPDMTTYGREVKKVCYSCLAGAVFLHVKGKPCWKLYRHTPSLIFLDSLRYFPSYSLGWRLISVYGLKPPYWNAGSRTEYTLAALPLQTVLRNFLELNPKEDPTTNHKDDSRASI